MRVRVEHLLYFLALLIAAGMRLFLLGDRPLDASEAANAWAAWIAGSGLSVAGAPVPTSALYHTLQTLLFWPAVGGDALARLVPALAGVGVVALAWSWRALLGRSTALILAFLWAMDPWLTALSRQADGAMLSILWGLIAVTGLFQLYAKPSETTPQPPYPLLTALSIGLLLASGALAWSFVVLALLGILLYSRREQGDETTGTAQATKRTIFQPAWLLWSVAAFLLAATGWLTSPASLAAVSASLSQWLTQFIGGELHYPWSWWVVRLLVDQPLLLVVGLSGLWIWLRARSHLHVDLTPIQRAWLRFVFIWLLLGVMLGAAPGRSPLALPMIGLPLSIFAAFALQRLLTAVLDQRTAQAFVPVEGAWLAMLVLILATTIFILGIGFVSSVNFDTVQLQLAALIICLSLVLLILYAVWVDARQALLVGANSLCALLLLVNIGASWRLNFWNDPTRPSGLNAVFTHPDVRRLVADIATLSAQRRGDPGSMAVQAESNADMQAEPVLGWYLRRMRQLEWTPNPGGSQAIPLPLLLTVQSENSAALAALGENEANKSYMGSDYRLRVAWLPSDLSLDVGVLEAAPPGLFEQVKSLWSAGWRARLRWALYREMKGPVQSELVTLWAPATE